MKLRHVCSALLLLFFVHALTSTPVHAQSQERPNVLFILVDDLGRQDVSPYHPGTFYDTPNVQRLADSGMTFNQAYVSNPVCSPSRLSFMTGQYPSRYDATDWFCGRRTERFRHASYNCFMPADLTTMGEAFQSTGYSTYFAGKWHLGPDEKHWPEAQGFDVNKGGYAAGSPGWFDGFFSPYNNPKLENGPKGEYLPYRLAEETSQFIRNHQDERFFAYLSFYEVHNPRQAPDELIQKYRQRRKKRDLDDKDEFGTIEQVWPGRGEHRKERIKQGHPVYAAMVEATDRAIGNVLKTLQELNLKKETIVVFTSDHGGLSTSEGHNTSNRPLRGGKGWIYEGGLRVPLIVRWPGQTEPGSVSEQPVMNTDFFPTLLDATGHSTQPKDHKDGTSFVPVLKGADKEEFNRGEPLYWHYPHYSNQGGPPAGAIRMGPWKLVERYEDGSIELYNVEEDLDESRELVKQYPDRAERMREKLHEWYREVDAKFLRRKSGGPKPWRPDYWEEPPLSERAYTHYTFDDGTMLDDEQNRHPLQRVVNGSDQMNITEEGTLSLPGTDDTGKRDYLETSGPGGTPAWTVSFWFRTPEVDQGKQQGLFSNNNDATKNYSWQVEVHNGTLRLQSRDTGESNPVLSNADPDDPKLQSDTWHHVVVRKTGSADEAELYLGTTDDITKVDTHDNNPGGLQMFRLGVNRNSDRLYRAEMANISIFRTDTVPIKELNKAGPLEKAEENK